MQQGRPAVELLLEPVEQVGQSTGATAPGLAHQRLGLEAMDVGEGELVLGGVEQPAEWPFERVGQRARP